MKNNLLVLGALLLFFTNEVISQNWVSIDPHSAIPKISGWETEYQNRINTMLNSKTFAPGSGNADTDEGKRTWSLLLAEMWKDRNNATEINNWINGKGRELLFSKWAGSFCKPFTLPGYVMYYLQYKSQLPSDQLQKVKDNLNQKAAYACVNEQGTGWDYLMRPDGKMDPIYASTEFNSENFNWMARMGGYLLAHDLNDASRITYFDNYIKNWIRALYNAGRVEWNSNNYWGHVFNPLMVLHQHAKDPEVKKMAKAGLDWMLLEAALHYIDGFQAGADVRAKSNAYQPFAGSVWGYSYFYFTDSKHQPTCSYDFGTLGLNDFIGYAPYSTYRPAQVIMDIAQRNFQLPVEIRAAKPFYHLDHNNYQDWKGNTAKSRRFEFEMIYMDDNYLLSSLATYRPDGKVGTFSEQNLWRLAVKGSNNGSIQVVGNAGNFDDCSGRNPNEEIAQFRNVMMRLIKNTNKLWVALPKSKTLEFVGDAGFADMGNGVYAAFVPYDATGKSSMTWAFDAGYNRYDWTFDPGKLGALVLEVGTSAEYSSYSNFKTQVQSKGKYTTPSADVLSYDGANSHNLKMQYMPVTTYTLVSGTVVNPAGVAPRAWGDGTLIDYDAWNSYEVSHGEKIVDQKWGSGVLTLKSKNEDLQIAVDPVTAKVSYKVPGTTSIPLREAGEQAYLIPGYSPGQVDIRFLVPQTQNIKLALYDVLGKEVKQLYAGVLSGMTEERIQLESEALVPGVYFIVLQGEKLCKAEKILFK